MRAGKTRPYAVVAVNFQTQKFVGHLASLIYAQASVNWPQELRRRQLANLFPHGRADFGRVAVVHAGVDAGIRHLPHEVLDLRPAPSRATDVTGRCQSRSGTLSDLRL